MNDASTSAKARVRSIQAIDERLISELRPYAGNARTHSKRQIRQIMDSISRFGFTNPVLIGDDDGIVAGHGRVMAAERLGMTHVPTIRLSHLTAAERRAYVIADNKLALNAGWDQDLLAIELQGLIDLDFDLELTGFSLAEVDLVLDAASEREVPGLDASADAVPASRGPATSRQGDLWQCGRHLVLCGDARSLDDYA